MSTPSSAEGEAEAPVAEVRLLDLPTDHPRPNRPSTRGDAEFFLLPEELYIGLREFSRAQGVTLYMSMLAAFYALL